MNHKNTVATMALTATLCLTGAVAQAFEDSQYPNLKGQWSRVTTSNDSSGVIPFDPSKPPGRGQQAPLTPEYQKIFEANLKELEAGVPGSWPGPSCLPPGLPPMRRLRAGADRRRGIRRYPFDPPGAQC